MDALIHHLEEKQELSSREVQVAASLLLDPAAPDEKKARLLEALALKGETPDEIAGFVEAFLEQAVNPHLGLITLDGPTLDVCGTGGDQLDLFNISTTAMFISAAAGAIVVKHGNRGITSKSGGADVLEALGVRIDLPADEFRNCVEKAGMGFMFLSVTDQTGLSIPMPGTPPLLQILILILLLILITLLSALRPLSSSSFGILPLSAF